MYRYVAYYSVWGLAANGDISTREKHITVSHSVIRVQGGKRSRHLLRRALCPLQQHLPAGPHPRCIFPMLVHACPQRHLRQRRAQPLLTRAHRCPNPCALFTLVPHDHGAQDLVKPHEDVANPSRGRGDRGLVCSCREPDHALPGYFEQSALPPKVKQRRCDAERDAAHALDWITHS